MQERLLITGGSGFIGAEVVTLARHRGMIVRNLDLKAPSELSHKSFWHMTDLRDQEAVCREVDDFSPHYIVHLASETDVGLTSPNAFTTTISGTLNVLNALPRAISLRRFVHTSTQFVVRPGVSPNDEHHYEPYTSYGAAKAESERLIWSAAIGAPWFIVRPTIIWGPHHPTFADEIFRHMRSGHYLHPTAQGPILRAYGYVTNTAHQLLSIAQVPANKSERRVFYLGDGLVDYAVWADAFSMGLIGRPARRIPDWALIALGRAGDVTKRFGLPAPIDSGRAFRMTTESKVDLNPTLQLTGCPPIDFSTGVSRTLEWLQARRG